MNFSSVIPGFIWGSVRIFRDTNIEDIRNIVILKEELIAVGYNPGEVNYMIASFSDGRNPAKLDSKQLKKLEERLKEQLLSARQCIDFLRGPK